MEVGDLVRASAFVHAQDCGVGIVLDSHENEDGVVYHEVQWTEDGRMWYDELELRMISEI